MTDNNAIYDDGDTYGDPQAVTDGTDIVDPIYDDGAAYGSNYLAPLTS